MNSYKTYYKQIFQQDFLSFVGQIPIDGNKHYDSQEIVIQYFFLTPKYKYLDTIPRVRQELFTVALFWTVLVDQVFYSNYPNHYQIFRNRTMYPKFIGNCTAPSIMISDCGQHQHPKRILRAVNDFEDMGNSYDFDREIFGKDESAIKRERIDLSIILEQSKEIMKMEIENYFMNHQPEISWIDFWQKCESEL